MKTFLTAIAIACLPVAGAAAGHCGPHDRVVEALGKKFGETQRSVGLQDRSLMEVYASEDEGTWTILVTSPNGRACIIASGTNYEEGKAGPGGEPL